MGERNMINLGRESAWTFHTSAGGGGGLGDYVASKGMFVLKDPKGNLQQFNYGGIGLGISVPIPKLMRKPHLALPNITLRGHELTLSGASVDFPSDGTVFVTEACRGPDVTIGQLEGATIYFDLAVGWLRGHSWTIMIAGINQELLELGVMMRPAWNLAIATAPAVIFMHGDNEGVQQSAGIDGVFGGIQYAGRYSEK
jgi:hypothetical protein